MALATAWRCFARLLVSRRFHSACAAVAAVRAASISASVAADVAADRRQRRRIDDGARRAGHRPEVRIDEEGRTVGGEIHLVA